MDDLMDDDDYWAVTGTTATTGLTIAVVVHQIPGQLQLRHRQLYVQGRHPALHLCTFARQE